MPHLTNLSPLDGRYANQCQALTLYFSEMALFKYRLMIEVEYFITLSKEKKIKELPPVKATHQKRLRSLYQKFTLTDAKLIKTIERQTNHDVKALEYFLKQRLQTTLLKRHTEFIHFALTSEDINNLAYSLMWRDAIKNVYLPKLHDVYQHFVSFAKQYRNQPMLSLTHGQSATPTTVGKELAVFAKRLERQIKQLQTHKLQGKLSGSTGTWSAHHLAYPNVNWLNFSRRLIASFGLEPNLITTQIEPHDSLAESYHILTRVNTILLDFTRDVWLYISRGIFGQEKKVGEVGSSTMPHKINPIHFENAEGNLGLANALLHHLSEKLPVSRMQRDLSDSTVLRHQGVPLAHSLLACQNILQGLSRLTVNKPKLEEELDSHWEVLAEAIQTILRKVGYQKPYETLKELTRGEEVTREKFRTFIKGLSIPLLEKNKLLQLTPARYTGLATNIVKIRNSK